jgi:sedoheptulokinase
VINISTSSQVCISIDSTRFDSLKQRLPNSVSPVAYYGNKIFLVAASLNGGNVLDSFIEMLMDWNSQLGFQCDNTKAIIWPKLLGLAEEWCNTNQDSRLKCKPLLFGERHAKQLFASIHNVTSQSTSLGEVFTSICIGIIDNLNAMFPFDLLVNELGCKRLVATGGALLRNKILKRALERNFSTIPIVYKATGDAAKGAAQFIKMFS